MEFSAQAAAAADQCDPHLTINATGVFLETDLGYDTARMKQYAQYLGTQAEASEKLHPALVVSCSDEAHVQSAIRFASRCGYNVAIRGGGHSYTGSSSCNSRREGFTKCMQLDLGAMNETSVTDNMIKSGPGITLLAFAEFTLKHFLSVPHGGCSLVGMGGHFQSSAWGMMTQSHGSGLDRVASFRMVLASGEVKEYSRLDANNTVFHSVLGSAPGSWGVITQCEWSSFVCYPCSSSPASGAHSRSLLRSTDTLQGVHDVTVPFTRSIIVAMKYSKSSFLTAFKQTQFIARDQEEKGLRDMKILLVTAPGTEATDYTVYIKAYILWTGIDSGPMTDYWKDRYLQPFYDLPLEHFPHTVDVPMTLSLATRLFANMWTNHGDRYAVQAYHSNYWWDDEFIDLIATEVDERVAMIPDVYPSFQFMPLGLQSQWARNSGLNKLTWRDARAYVDDWVFVKPGVEGKYEEMRTRMRNFRETTKKYWAYKEGQADRSTWMTPLTTYDDQTDRALRARELTLVARELQTNKRHSSLARACRCAPPHARGTVRNETNARSFFPNFEDFAKFQALKAELDPTDLFSNIGTIPLPGDTFF